MKKAFIFAAVVTASILSGLIAANYFPDPTWKLINEVRDLYSGLLAAPPPPPTIPNFPSPISRCLATTQTQHTFEQQHPYSKSDTYCTPDLLIYSTTFGKNETVCEILIESQFEHRRMANNQLGRALNEVASIKDRGQFVIASFLDLVCPPENNCWGTSEDYKRMEIRRIGGDNQYRYALIRHHRPECEPVSKPSP